MFSAQCIPNDHDLPKSVSQVTVGGLQALDKDTRAHLAACLSSNCWRIQNTSTKTLELTWWPVPSCDQNLPLREWIQCQANGITQSLADGLALLLTWATVKDPPPAVALVICHKTASFPHHLRRSTTRCIPPAVTHTHTLALLCTTQGAPHVAYHLQLHTHTLSMPCFALFDSW